MFAVKNHFRCAVKQNRLENIVLYSTTFTSSLRRFVFANFYHRFSKFRHTQEHTLRMFFYLLENCSLNKAHMLE